MVSTSKCQNSEVPLANRLSTRSCRTKGATRTLNSRSSGHRVIIRGYHTASMIYISRLTNNNIGDVLDGESNIVARCVSICIRRPNKCCPVHQDTQVRRSTVVPCRLNDRDRMSIMERHPHNCPLRQPPVIPLSALPNGSGDIPRTLGLKDSQDTMRPGRVPGDGANLVPRSGRSIALATIDISMNISALPPIGINYIEEVFHLGTRGHLPLTQGVYRLNRPPDLRI